MSSVLLNEHFPAWQALKCNIATHEIMVLTLVDFNTPHSRASDRMVSLCQAVQQLNACSVHNTVCVLTLPDKPKASSHRGLADEEAKIQKELWSLHQMCDHRWMLPWDLPDASSFHSNSRRWVSGRLVASLPKEVPATALLVSSWPR